jgi:hypothetical protein
MTSSKTPKARHQRLLAKGFFPPEMPSCFYSETLGQKRDVLIDVFDRQPNVKGSPHFYRYKSERAGFNFPRFRREDRRHSYIHPVSYFYLAKVLAGNYVAIRKLNRKSRMSISPSIFDWAGDRALIRPAFDARDTQSATLNAAYELLAEADINAFFHSLYTHAIPWAIHGKTTAKRNHGLSLYGNIIDLLVRNAQDGQTIGLPVGPDTSRLIAEVVGTAVDRAIQKSLKSARSWSTKRRGAMRFVDDFTFGCTSLQEAEAVIAAVRRCVNEYELELNNTKTRIQATGPFFSAAWREHVRSLLPSSPAGKPELLRYFYGVEGAMLQHEEANVQKFAIQNARRMFLEATDWRLVEDYLLSSYRQNPTVLAIVVEILVLRHLDKGDVSKERVAEFVSARIPALIRSQRNGEMCWLLFLCICLKARMRASTLSGMFSSEDGAAAILISDASRLGLIRGAIDRSLWNGSLTADGLRSSMWLYAYESALKGLNGTTSVTYVTSDPYFGPMFANRVEFYRSGSFHLNANALLSRLRTERIRRSIQQMAVEDNLAEFVDDFDDLPGDEHEDEIGDAY